MRWWQPYTAIFDMPKEDKKHFAILTAAFFFTVGGYWCLRSLKDAIFDQLVGLHFQPYAKMLSMIVLSVMLLVYSRAVDSWSLPNLIRRMFRLYAVFFLMMTLLYRVTPHVGQEFFQYVSLPGLPLGWLWYVGIESSGSLLVSLFWSFAATTTSSQAASRGYPWVMAMAQLGSILGASSAILTPQLGFTFLLAAASLAFAVVPYLLLRSPKLKDCERIQIKKTGLFEGLRLIAAKPYLLGVLVVAACYEIPQTVIELQMKLQARQLYSPAELAAFMGRFGQLTNTLPLVIAMFGTSILLQKVGVRFSLLLFPTAVMAGLAMVAWEPTLTTCFWSAVMIKGLSYGLHNPLKEMLFLPTTREEKFKAKSWIDSFGGRSSKAIGSAINAPLAHNLAQLATFGSAIAAAVTCMWLIVALWTGKRYGALCMASEQPPVQQGESS